MIVSFCLAGASACASLNTTLRYRLTVVVDTPQGVRTGSSVVEVKGALSPAFPGPEAGGARLHIRGEATPVKLADGRYLFAVFAWQPEPRRIFTMLTTPFGDQLPPRSPDPSAFSKRMMEQFRALADAKGVRQVKPEDYPVIATFAEIANPYSIRIAPARNISSILPGYRVRLMTVEITNAPISNKIMRILPWLRKRNLGFLNPAIKKNQLATSQTEFPEYQKITVDAFIAGSPFVVDHESAE
jgi:hypothetical protein